MRKMKIRKMINLEEKEGKRKSIERLQKRYKYLQSKKYPMQETNQMKYIKFHLRKLGVAI